MLNKSALLHACAMIVHVMIDLVLQATNDMHAAKTNEAVNFKIMTIPGMAKLIREVSYFIGHRSTCFDVPCL